jgi:hypothetical protein
MCDLGLGGARIISMEHFPPNIAPPGLTVVNQTGPKGRDVTIVSDSGLFDESDRALLERNITSLFSAGDLTDARNAV